MNETLPYRGAGRAGAEPKGQTSREGKTSCPAAPDPAPAMDDNLLTLCQKTTRGVTGLCPSLHPGPGAALALDDINVDYRLLTGRGRVWAGDDQ